MTFRATDTAQKIACGAHLASIWRDWRVRSVACGVGLAGVPLFLAVICWSLISCKHYFWVDRDPDYAYYVAAYKTALGYAPGYLDHPGITVIHAVARIMRGKHVLALSQPLVVNGLLHAEEYIRTSVLVLLGFNIIALWLVGWCVVKRTRGFLLGLTAQCGTLLILPTLLESLVKLNAEMVMSGLVLAAACLTILALDTRAHKLLYHAIGFGVICALGVLTKLNFLPVLFLPLIVLKGTWPRLLYVVTGLILAGILVGITPGAWQNVTAQFVSYATRVGVHGSGGRGLLPSNTWQSFERLVINDIRYYITLVAAVLAVILRYAIWRNRASADVVRIALGVIVTGIIQTVAVVRTPLSYYLIPALGLCGVLLVVTPLVIYPRLLVSWTGRVCTAIYAVLLCVAGVRNALRVEKALRPRFAQWHQTGLNASAISSLVPKDGLEVHDISLLTAVGGLNFGGASSKRNMNHLASNAFPHVCFYNVLDGKIWTWDAASDLTTLGLFYDEVYFVGYARLEQYEELNYIRPPFLINIITNVGEFGLYRVMMANAAMISDGGGAKQGLVSKRHAPVEVQAIVRFVRDWFVNTQIMYWSECTNLFVTVENDNERWLTAKRALRAFGTEYSAVGHFMDWYKATDERIKRESLRHLRESVSRKTWPFYDFAMRNTASNLAVDTVLEPEEMFTRVFNAAELWSSALVELAAYYERYRGHEGVIQYWQTIADREPQLRGAAATHMMRAAHALGDEERVVSIARAYLDDIRGAEWTIDRAVQILHSIKQPNARAISQEMK